jgi:hypothetical protein
VKSFYFQISSLASLNLLRSVPFFRVLSLFLLRQSLFALSPL